MKKDFYQLLVQAKENNEVLMLIVNMIMPLINNYSKVNGIFDNDLKSTLVEYTILIIKKPNFAEKLKNYKKN